MFEEFPGPVSGHGELQEAGGALQDAGRSANAQGIVGNCLERAGLAHPGGNGFLGSTAAGTADVQASREGVQVAGRLNSVWFGRVSVGNRRRQSLTTRRNRERNSNGPGRREVRAVRPLIGWQSLQPDGVTSVATRLTGAVVNAGCVSSRQTDSLASAGIAMSSGSARPASPTRVDLPGKFALKRIPFPASLSYPVA